MSISGLDESANSRTEPYKILPISNFTLKCSDRDVLVVKEYLISSSKVFATALEDIQQLLFNCLGNLRQLLK